MNKEKYIEIKKSESKGNNHIIAYVVNIPLPNGKKYYKRFKVMDYVSNSIALKHAVADRDEQLRLIRLSQEGRYSFDSYTVQELYDLVPKHFDRSLTTYKNYNSMYSKYIKNEFGNYDIKKISKEDILSTLRECADICGSNHVSKLKSIWKKIYLVAIEKDIPIVDKTATIENPISHNHTDRSLNEQNITEEEFQLFCEAMQKYGCYLPENKEMIYNRQIMLYMIKLQRLTGLRSQEIRALRRNYIKFDKENNIAFIGVRKSIGSSRSVYNIEVSTKTPQSVRDVPVGECGVKLLEEILEYSKNDLVFADYRGNAISTSDYSDYLNRVSKSCGIKVYSTLMRKSYSSDLYAQGVNPAVIKKLMGHKHEDMSLNAYASAKNEDLISASANRQYKQ